MRKNGLVLWWVGTNHAKDLLHGRQQINKPGPGYIHFSKELSDEWFKQYTGEARTTRRTTRGEESAWTATRKRVEKLDCAVYAVWLETYLELSKKTARFWDELERKVQPIVTDMFSQNNVDLIAKTVNKPVAKAPIKTNNAASSQNIKNKSRLARSDWGSRL